MTSAPNPWPHSEFEAVVQCLVCRGTGRTSPHAELTDCMFFGIADGVWNPYQCTPCRSAYLDPRATRASIGRSHAGCYTHNGEDHPIVSRQGHARRLVHDLINGYENHRYGVRRHPAPPDGRWVSPLVPSLRFAADAECRHLPRLPPGGGKLLDLGCGNGGFLTLAQQAGWQAEGLDFDADAVQTCRARGLYVRQGGIEVTAGDSARFDVITLCHVIEHVYDPVGTLRRLHALLNPGGLLWLDTPNVASLGAAHFGEYWRGLEPPRHLVLFSPQSLIRALTQTGFHTIQQHWRGLSVFNVFAQSDATRLGNAAFWARRGSHSALRYVFAELMEMINPARREFITISARK